MTILIDLPWPPSINHYYLRTRYGMTIDKAGRSYRERTKLALRGATKMKGPMCVEILAYPPDNRRRDIDNLLKCTLDALQKGGAYDDDFMIQKIDIERREVVEGGKLIVRISAYEKS